MRMVEEGILSIADFDSRAEAVKLRVCESLRLSVVEIGREWAAEIHPSCCFVGLSSMPSGSWSDISSISSSLSLS